MAITVKHKFVSAIPDAGDTTIVQPSNWNDSHDLVGTVPPANGGTGASTLTGYVKGNGTDTMTASATVPSTDITGLGTASTKDAGVALGVATLDSAGKVPITQIPDSVIGALSYQGTWNASTNTPTLTSSVGTKGYYYVVNVAGSTNLNGITDWQIGDWAVYNGSAWQKIDNTDSVTSVNGYTGAVNLTYTDVGAFPATSTTGTGNVVLATGATQAHPTISDYEVFTSTTPPSYAEGRVWFDSGNHTLSQYNDVTNNIVHLGEEVQLKVINNTGSSIPNGSPVYITSTSSGQTYPNIALAKADTLATSNVIGLTNGAIANGQTGYVTTIGLLNPANTGTFVVGDVLYLSPYSAGQIMNTLPPTGYPVRLGIVAYANTPNGAIYITKTNVYSLAANIVGTVAVANGGTGATTLTGYVKGSGTSAMTASSTIPTTDLSGTVSNAQLANSSITINGNATALGSSVSVGTVTSVTGIAPVVSSGGNTPAISMAAANTTTNGYLTSTDWNTFNGKGSGSVTSVSLTAPSIFTVTGSPVTSSGTLALTYSGTALPILNGGTGQTTANAAFNALTPSQTSNSGKFLTTNGTDTSWASVTASSATNLAGGTTGAVPYQSGVATTAFLSGNTTTTPNFYTSTGTGTLAQAPTLTTSTGTGSVVLGTRPTLAVTGTGLTLQDATDNTKTANFVLSGLTTATNYSYTLPAVTGSSLATLGNIAQTFTGAASFLPTTAASTLTIGGTAGTGTITLGQSTATQIVNIANAAVASGQTATVNIGTNGLGGSTTNINLGTGGTGNVNLNGYFSSNMTTENFYVISQSSGAIRLGGTGSTGALQVGRSTDTQLVELAQGATATGKTKTVTIGANSLSGSTTNITIGSTGGTSTTTLNGTLSLANALPVGSGGTGLNTLTANYIPYGNGTSAFNSNSTFTFDPTLKNLSAPQVRASNGIVVNSKTVSASYSIASGDCGMSVGPVTISTGQTVTVASGSRWVIL